ncbi:MAG: tRNA (N(6)-L-threonylcarbamoyladenosine(37)-C(2))-methylthiotransferase MtaB [Lachnospiraceae bacterium]|nr:tRNA (N(6)-L-threonylcarbamoyladenosine(37)-C(2))-methylthiotransferase MtaB [Lachnospiraceae bacterium]
MKSVALHNLGCKVNSYEIDVMQQMLVEKGYKIVPFDEFADIYIINTCTVTNIADRKSRQMLHRAKKQNPGGIVVATGCYVQTGEEAVCLDEAIDLAIGNNRKKDLIAILEQFLEERETALAKKEVATANHLEEQAIRKTLNNTTIIDINHTNEYERMFLTETAEHTRAYIKIQDGCNQFCTYCIIPYARGRVRSRCEGDVLKEIKELAGRGYKEVVLTGIHLSSYGVDFNKEPLLLPLIKKIHEVEGIERIRLGSLEPRIVTEEFAKELAAMEKICPHFHLSLQSGCDATLKRMNRRYDTKEFEEKVQILRDAFKNPAITTDVITGFPGETEEEFLQTKEFLERIRFFEMHIFPYSKRQGTKAAVMENQILEAVKKERSHVLLEMEKCQSLEFRKEYVGQVLSVLFEEEKEINGESYMIGHTKEYVKVALFVSEKSKNEIEALENQVRTVLGKHMLTDDIVYAEEI